MFAPYKARTSVASATPQRNALLRLSIA